VQDLIDIVKKNNGRLGEMKALRTIDILGGGPAGLYTAILLRLRMPRVRVRVTEQNPVGATFGFGVVFSDQALSFLSSDDKETHDLITPHMERWRDMTLNHPQGRVTIDGVGFASIGRLELIEILRKRAESLGVEMRFSHVLTSLNDLQGDVVIGSDGLNSLVRRSFENEFKPQLSYFGNHFAWYGAERSFDTLTQSFKDTDNGAFNAHHYRFAPNRSTFIVECEDATFKNSGFGALSETQSAKACEAIFADVLEGASLITNRSLWRQFPKLWCENWTTGKYALLGDAVHTAHFSIGSGTRLALEDAIALVQALSTKESVASAFEDYESTRKPIAKKIVDAANTSANWYETFGARMNKSPIDFGFDYITRSGRINMERLRKMAPDFMAQYDASQAPRIVDPVSDTSVGSIEIGFNRAECGNCSTLLWDNLDRNPNTVAVMGPTGTLTYKALIEEASQWGHAFQNSDLKAGDRIPFLLDDTPTFVAAFFGAVRMGYVPVLLNTQTNAELLNYFLTDSSAKLALCEASLLNVFNAEVLTGTAVTKVIVANGEANSDNQIAAPQFLKGMPTTLACADTSPDDMAFWMYSSGSTGKPKGVVHVHHDMFYTELSYAKHILKLTSDDVVFSIPKMYFAYGFGNSITFPFAVGATSVLLAGQPNPKAVLDTIESYKPTVVFGLPTLYTALARAEGVEKRDLSSLRRSISAAEILSEDVYNKWKALTGHGPTEGLGSTELLHIYLSNTFEDHRLGSAGARVPGYEIKLETPDGQTPKPGEEGVMYVRGHSSAPLYWNRPDKTKDTMRGDWIYTGDRFIEKDGFYYFQGRADDLVKISGQWVWPLEVERCLNEHPDVHECAVVAHELDDRRMTLSAFVRLRDGVEQAPVRTKQLQDFVKSKLLPYKYPRNVSYLADLPKTGTGKIDRQALLAAAGGQHGSR
jgi:benzoate-CoA ligase family protein